MAKCTDIMVSTHLSGERMLGVGLLGEGMLGEGMLFSLLIPLGAIAIFYFSNGNLLSDSIFKILRRCFLCCSIMGKKTSKNGDEAEEGIQWTRKSSERGK